MVQDRRVHGGATALRAALAVVALQLRTGRADLDNIYPITYVNNPVARHVACPVPAGTPTICTLAAHEDSGLALEFHITALPAAGQVYETSQNFRTYASDPKNVPTPIYEHQLPFRVTDPHFRIVYIPPADVFPPEGRWAAFSYTVREPVSNAISMPGQIAMSSPAQFVAGSTFVGGVDAWSISGNIHSTEPQWQAFGWGLLNRYIYATDEVQYADFATNSDQSKWYFEAPADKFYIPEMASAYGGVLSFTIASTYGDFAFLNSPLDFITLDCTSCNSGRGMRIVRFANNGLEWDGQEKTVRVTLATGNFWQRDPLNKALPFTVATDCEIAAVLAGLTRLRILGDFTRAGEGVALDDVSISSADIQPSYPTHCQQGCPCAHDQRVARLSCCGSDPNVYHFIQ